MLNIERKLSSSEQAMTNMRFVRVSHKIENIVTMTKRRLFRVFSHVRAVTIHNAFSNVCIVFQLWNPRKHILPEPIMNYVSYHLKKIVEF